MSGKTDRLIMIQDQIESPYAVLCYSHGKIYLTSAQYDHQMNNPDSKWTCTCGAEAVWDDENYKEWNKGENDE